MSLRSFIISAPYLAIIACSANSPDTIKLEKSISEVTSCPQEQIITNVAQYADTAPSASNDYNKLAQRKWTKG